MNDVEIKFCKHALFKIEILKKHGFVFTQEQIADTIRNPDKIFQGRKNRIIAQKSISPTHLLRVIYEKTEDYIEVITFYPARRERYENDV